MVKPKFKNNFQYMDDRTVKNLTRTDRDDLLSVKRTVSREADDYDNLLKKYKVKATSRHDALIELVGKIEKGDGSECFNLMVAKSLLVTEVNRNKITISTLKRKKSQEVSKGVARLEDKNKKLMAMMKHLDKNIGKCGYWINDHNQPEFV